MPNRIPVVALDEHCTSAVQFFRAELLPELFAGYAYRLPEPARSVCRSPAVRHARRMEPPIIIPTAISEAGRDPITGEIMVTEGFLCERWCAAYFLWNSTLAKGRDPDAPLLHLLEHGQVFTWPLDAPLPSQENREHVQDVNRLFSSLVACTILHEMGHEIEAGRTMKGPPQELACDGFAARYLLGKIWGEGMDFRRLAVAIWLCCICSEALTQEDYVVCRHPHPVDRVLAFLRQHGRHAARTRIDHYYYLVCTAHLIKLARAYRPDDLDKVDWRQSSLRGVMAEVRDCWNAA